MSGLRSVFRGCVSDRSTEAIKQQQKFKFGVPLAHTLKSGMLPDPLVEILVYIAKEGVSTVDLFRRPGNPTDTRRIVKRLSEGKPICYTNYNFYTLASVVKKFLIKVPGGVLGEEGEEQLLNVLSLGHRMDQINNINNFISSLSLVHQQLLALIFGTWFRIANHSEYNFMTTEALSRSVAGSVFHTCADDPAKVEKASRILQLLIDNFGMSGMFGDSNIEFFAETTDTGVHTTEAFRYQYHYPPEEIVPREESLRWFVLVLQEEAERHGFDPCKDAISEEHFLELASAQVHHYRDSSESPARDSLGEVTLGHLSPLSQSTESNLLQQANTVSAPEVSMAPSPEVQKRPKSLEDSLNEVKELQQQKSLSRFNSVKRKQLERLRQRSDWFLGPNYSQCINGRSCSLVSTTRTIQIENRLYHSKHDNGVTKSSSEGAVLDGIGSDIDSVFTEGTSRSESPVSDGHMDQAAYMHEHRHAMQSDETTDASFVHDEFDNSVSKHVEDSNDADIDADDEDEDLTETAVRYYIVEHQYGSSS